MYERIRGVLYSVFGIVLTALIGMLIYNAEQTPMPDDDTMVLTCLAVLAGSILIIAGSLHYHQRNTEKTEKIHADEQAAIMESLHSIEVNDEIRHKRLDRSIANLRRDMEKSDSIFAQHLATLTSCSIDASRTSLIHLGNKYLKERRSTQHPEGYCSISEQQSWIANYDNYQMLIDINGQDNGYLEDMYHKILNIDIDSTK